MLTICQELPRLNYAFQKLNPKSIISIDEAIFSNVSNYDDTEPPMVYYLYGKPHEDTRNVG